MKLEELKEMLIKNKMWWVKYKYTSPIKIKYYVDGETSRKIRTLPVYHKHWYVFENILFLFNAEQLIYVENITEDILYKNFNKVIPKFNKNIEKSIKKKEEKVKKDKNEKYKAKQEVLDRLNENFIGLKFERLTCLDYLYTIKSQHFLKCICDCGNEVIIRSQDLGKTKSCGCYKKEETIKRFSKEFLPFEKEIRSRYRGIKSRCYHEGDRSYKWYGAKGVTMCDEWLNDFYAFYNWCMSNGFKKELHIDKDELCNELGIYPHIYSPETCKFVTLEENNRHQTSNYKIEYEGIEYNLADLSRKLNLDRYLLKRRYEKGLDLIEPTKHLDEYVRFSELCKIYNLSSDRMTTLIKKSKFEDVLKFGNKKYVHKDFLNILENKIKVK